MTRSDFGISAIFARTSRSASSLLRFAFRSRTSSLIAARSPAVIPLPVFLVLLADVLVLFLVDVFAGTRTHLLWMLSPAAGCAPDSRRDPGTRSLGLHTVGRWAPGRPPRRRPAAARRCRPGPWWPG